MLKFRTRVVWVPVHPLTKGAFFFCLPGVRDFSKPKYSKQTERPISGKKKGKRSVTGWKGLIAHTYAKNLDLSPKNGVNFRLLSFGSFTLNQPVIRNNRRAGPGWSSYLRMGVRSTLSFSRLPLFFFAPVNLSLLAFLLLVFLTFSCLLGVPYCVV